MTPSNFPTSSHGLAKVTHVAVLENSHQTNTMSSPDSTMIDLDDIDLTNDIAQASNLMRNEAVDVILWSTTVALSPLLTSCLKPVSYHALSYICGESLNKSLSPESQLLIFEKINSPITSAGLGLTCKAFYAIHQARHGRVNLKNNVFYGPLGKHIIQLGLLLKNWIPSHLAYDHATGKFIEREVLTGRLVQREDHELHLTLMGRHMQKQVSDGKAREELYRSRVQEIDGQLLRCMDYIQKLQAELKDVKDKAALRERELERERLR
ncbi:hypothetical protein N431DRAFT_464826 [Stipitochalara longipes BDJ]|nr:hypothetical protein N431DRAFT_464826 [Stipitochalara longipes BDJ]